MTTAKAQRVLGFWTCLALVVGNMIGSGIYMLPASLAPLGMSALYGWGVTIGGAMCLAFVFAKLGAKLPLAGGPYAFANAAFGPGVGFAVAWSYWVLVWAGNAAIALAVVSALGLVFPALLTTPYLSGVAVLLLTWGMIGINIRGVAIAGRIQLITTILKLAPLAAVILLGAWLVLRNGSAAIVPQAAVPVGAGAIAGAAALTFWGFLGVESATVPAERVQNAERVIPRVTLIGTAITGLVYFLVAGSVALLMDPAETAASPAPLADFLGRTLGPGIAGIVAIFAAISALGTLNGFTLLQGEMPWAMAKGGVFPAWFGKESRWGTPANAHVLSGVLMTGVLLLNYTPSTGQLFADIATISLAAGMLAYLASALAAIWLVPGDRALNVAAMISAAFVVWMVWGLGWKANLWGLGLMALGLPVYFWVRRGRA